MHGSSPSPPDKTLRLLPHNNNFKVPSSVSPIRSGIIWHIIRNHHQRLLAIITTACCMGYTLHSHYGEARRKRDGEKGWQ